MASPEHVFFDLNGTLTDPRVGIERSIHFALEKLGFDVAPRAGFEWTIGLPTHEFFEKILGRADSGQLQEGIRRFQERYRLLGIYENRPYDGILEALTQLRGLARLHVITSKPAVFADEVLRHLFLRGFFQGIHGAGLDGQRSDKTELVRHVVESEGIEPSSALLIGDREHDIRAAQANGIRAWGAGWGYGTAEELRNAGAERILSEPGELRWLAATLEAGSKSGRAEILSIAIV